MDKIIAHDKLAIKNLNKAKL